MNRRFVLFLAVILAVTPGLSHTSEGKELAGLWEAKKILLPHHRGKVDITRVDGHWTAEVAGTSVTGELSGKEVTFTFPGDGELLRIRLDDQGRIANAQWTQPPTYRIGSSNISPVILESVGRYRWRGEVLPIEDGFTFYLVLSEKEDGTMGVFLRNPDRNLGIFTNLRRLEREGDTLNFIGTFRNRAEEQVFYTGQYNARHDMFSVPIPHRGGTYDFRRVRDETSHFYSRGSRHPRPYTYTPPPETGDGWPTASLADVGIAQRPLKEMIEREIDPVAQSVSAHDVHGVLIARYGKLVFEEYFHGYHRDWPHDTRSASKSLTSVLVGAAMQAGFDVSPAMPVYETIYGPDLSADIDPRKRRMTLEHLLTMTSGFYCDDSDPDAPGREDTMQEQQDEPDWYRYTLKLPMAHEPGTKGIYCSVNANLVGRVLIEATGQPIEDLFMDLIAGPLDLRRYHLQLQPTGEPYMGGGFRWLPRDFMKLGQLMLAGGKWNGRRVVGQDWAAASIARQVTVRDRGYGYSWWIDEYPYKDGTVRAFMAGGNGGQIVVGIPELDLVIAFYGGNYSDQVTYRSQKVLVPDYILRAVDRRQNVLKPGVPTRNSIRLKRPQFPDDPEDVRE